MDKIEIYLDIIPLPLLILGALGAIVVGVAVPSRYRLPLALILMVPWMTTGRLQEMGMPSVVAKATGFVAYLLIIFAALLERGPKRRLSPVVWLYPVVALLAFPYVMTVTDANLALVIKFQWLLLVIAAIAVSRTIVDEASLLRVLYALLIGLAFTLLLPLSELVFDPRAAFKMGIGRFFPYGANANQIATVFGMCAPLAFYAAIRSQHARWKPVLFAIGGVALGLALLTVSRGIMAVLIVTGAPLFWAMSKRPILTAVACAVALGGLYLIVSLGEEATFGRLATLETKRVEIAGMYLGVIAERPFFGLMGTSGMSFLREQSLGAHAHNAYLWMLYQGGVTMAFPNYLIVGLTMWNTYVVWTRRKWIGADRLLMIMLIAFMFMLYAHGFVNASVFYPTYAWAFWHVLLSCFFLNLGMDVRAGEPLLPAHLEDAYDEWDYGEEEYGDDSARPAA